MKKILTLFINSLLFIYSYAQTYCESFDGQTLTTQQGAHAFNTYGNGNGGFLNDWNVVNGTPSIMQSGQIAGVNAYSGNQYALQSACDAGADWGESLSLQYNFLQGNTYQVTMAVRNRGIAGTPTPVDINFVLMDQPIAYTYTTATGCSPNPAIPNNTFIAHTETSFATDAWTIVSFTVSNLNADYHNIWIRNNYSQGAPLVTTFVLLDSVCIEQLSPAQCYMFDEQTVAPSDVNHTFNLYGNGNAGFLADWNVLSGTPSVCYDGYLNGVNAYEGSQYVLMGVCDASALWADGLSLQYNFTQDNTYQVSMAIRNRGIAGTPTPLNVEFVLLDQPIAYTYNPNTGCSPSPAIPNGAVTVHTESSFATDAWTLLTFNIANLNTDFHNLWIRPNFSSGQAETTTFFLFDSLCVTQIDSAMSLADNAALLNLNIYPNPTSGNVIVESASAKGSYLLNDLTGKLLLNGNVTNQRFEIDLSAFSEGVYIFTLYDGENMVHKKIIKE